MPAPMYPPNNLLKIRKSQNRTLAEVAGIAGMSEAHLSQLERGIKRLNATTLARLASALRVSQEQIIASDLVRRERQDRLAELTARMGAEELARLEAFAEGLLAQQREGAKPRE